MHTQLYRCMMSLPLGKLGWLGGLGGRGHGGEEYSILVVLIHRL